MNKKEAASIRLAVRVGKFIDKARLLLTGRIFKERRFMREAEALHAKLGRWQRKGG